MTNNYGNTNSQATTKAERRKIQDLQRQIKALIRIIKQNEIEIAALERQNDELNTQLNEPCWRCGPGDESVDYWKQKVDRLERSKAYLSAKLAITNRCLQGGRKGGNPEAQEIIDRYS